jgi:hypothetical protein
LAAALIVELLMVMVAATTGRRADTLAAVRSGRRSMSKGIEVVVTPDLNDPKRRAVQVNSISSAGPFAVPGYSVVRGVWPGEIDVTRSTGYR